MSKNIIVFVAVFLIGFILMGLSVKKTTNIYNNTDLLREQSQILNNCMEGWDGTLKLLKQSNALLNSFPQ